METEESIEGRTQARSYPLDSAAQEILLTRTDLLPDITGLQRFILAACTRQRRYRGGQVIFEQESRGDCIHIIAAGEVLIYRNKGVGNGNHNGSEKKTHLTILSPGHLFGEIACLDKKNSLRSATAQAIRPTVTLSLDVESFEIIRKEFPALVLDLLLLELVERVRGSNLHIEVLATPHPCQRVARFLLDMAEQRGVLDEQGLQFDLRMTQRTAANMLGIPESSLSRELGKLEDAHAIKREQRASQRSNGGADEHRQQRLIRILDMQKLREEAEGSCVGPEGEQQLES